MHPIDKVYRHHDGIDISADKGVKVLATASGQIRLAEKDGKWGNHIIISHDEEYTTEYSHLNSIKVKEGDMVELGDVIGTVGSTGASRGNHLHYEVHKDGEVVDPRDYLNSLNGGDFGLIYEQVIEDSSDRWDENMDRLAELKDESEFSGREAYQEALSRYADEVILEEASNLGPQDYIVENGTQVSRTIVEQDDKDCNSHGNGRWQGTRTVTNSGNWSEYNYGNGQDRTVQKVENGMRMCMRIHGEVVLSRDKKSVRAIGEDSWVTLETEDDKLHRLVITEGSNGLVYDWRVDGQKRSYDGTAKNWSSKLFEIMQGYQQASMIRGERASLKGQIASNKGRVASMKGRMASHRGRVASLKGRIASEKGRVASMKGRIASSRGQVAGMKGRIAGHKGRVAGMRGQISALESQLRQRRSWGDDEDDKKIRELKERIEKKNLAIEEYDLDEKILAIEKEIENFEYEKEDQIKKQIEEYDLQGRIAEIQEEIDSYELDGKIAEIQREIEEFKVEEKNKLIEMEIDQLESDEKAAQIEKNLEPKIRELKRLIN